MFLVFVCLLEYYSQSMWNPNGDLDIVQGSELPHHCSTFKWVDLSGTEYSSADTEKSRVQYARKLVVNCVGSQRQTYDIVAMVISL